MDVCVRPNKRMLLNFLTFKNMERQGKWNAIRDKTKKQDYKR